MPLRKVYSCRTRPFHQYIESTMASQGCKTVLALITSPNILIWAQYFLLPALDVKCFPVMKYVQLEIDILISTRL